MRVIYERAGRPSDVLRVQASPSPTPPQRGQILVRVAAFSLHPGDLVGVSAPSRATPDTPVVPGLEATGVVEAIGPETEPPVGVTLGTRVTLFLVPGAWQEWVLAPADLVIAVPVGVPDGVAAQLIINPMTSVLLRRAAESTGAIGFNGLAIQTAAGSSVARLLASQWAHDPLSLVNIVRSEAGASRLREQFPDIPVVATSSTDWREQVERFAGGRPISAALDPVAGRLASDLLDLLTPGGSLITYGSLAPEPMTVHATALLPKGLRLSTVTIGSWYASTSPQRRSWDVAAALRLAQTVPEHLEVAATYPIEDITAAVEHVGRPGKAGMVVIQLH